MSSQGTSPAHELPPEAPHHRSAVVRTAAAACAAVLAAGAACAWAAGRATAADRPLVTAVGAAAAALLGATVALGLSRRRLARELRDGVAELREETARTLNLHAEATRRAAAELEAARRGVRQADARRRAAAAAETTVRTALREQTARTAELEAEAVRLAEQAVPLAAARLRAGDSAEAVLPHLPQPATEAHRLLLAAVVRELAAAERARAAGLAAVAGAAARVQALTTTMLADLREMEERHDEHVLDDLLRLDHSTAQAGRLADSVAVLSGARSGRRWTRPIVMESVLRGAMGRIPAYQRVRLHSSSTAAVAGHAAEGVMHALAELMDNACNFSPPSEEVHVYVQETHAGVVVTVEDAGLVMPDATLARAEQLVAGGGGAPTGTRLGLAVVGRLARKHGLRVSFRPSSRGGTGVVVLIPASLITRRPPQPGTGFEDAYPQAPAARPYGVPGAEEAAHYGEFAGTAAPEETRHSGREERPFTVPPTGIGPEASPGTPLPKRTRGRGLAAAMDAALEAGEPADASGTWTIPVLDEHEHTTRARAEAEPSAGERFGAFRDAASGGQRVAAPGEAGGDAAGRTAPGEPGTASTGGENGR
ncbi:sensor histidine kinase [Actinacidiphila guanduensis]|uniref:histidine kinase n=1 Tax=Actinacidiphila guanduensis TaxID=310781 RepID=A0A1G9XCZ0_9ACTN|nr:ATP-binding protein [Actinacidiphila guanduensis]SDM94326.1 Signal transduction histidine kinase [Actinacidiphila guanduensis]